jgi:hypothetical protein
MPLTPDAGTDTSTNATQRLDEAESVTIDGETVALRRWHSSARKLRRRVTLLSEDGGGDEATVHNTTDWGNETQRQPALDLTSLLGAADA